VHGRRRKVGTQRAREACMHAPRLGVARARSQGHHGPGACGVLQKEADRGQGKQQRARELLLGRDWTSGIQGGLRAAASAGNSRIQGGRGRGCIVHPSLARSESGARTLHGPARSTPKGGRAGTCRERMRGRRAAGWDALPYLSAQSTLDTRRVDPAQCPRRRPLSTPWPDETGTRAAPHTGTF
jgi:hypothetical protein